MIYELDEEMKEFLIRQKPFLQKNDLYKVYTNIINEFGNAYVPEFTKFFLSVDMNPLKYFKATIPDLCFYMVDNFVKILDIPEGITDINQYSFARLDSIEVVKFPKSLVHIGRKAFFNCKNLKSVHFKSDLVSGGPQIFDGCENLTNVYVPWSKGSEEDIDTLDILELNKNIKIHYNYKL